jgi:hypothetical protein
MHGTEEGVEEWRGRRREEKGTEYGAQHSYANQRSDADLDSQIVW